jgi:hypothetical protein
MFLPAVGAEPAKKAQPPSLVRVEPHGIQRGTAAKFKLTGANLSGLSRVTFSNTNITAALLPDAKPTEAWMRVEVGATLARGGYEFSVTATDTASGQAVTGESGKLKLFVDDLPQVFESAKPAVAPVVPVSFWGAFETPGKPGAFDFFAAAGQTIVLDVAAQSLGSGAKNCVLAVLDAHGQVLASNNGYEPGGDPLVVFKAPATARYTARVSDLMATMSKDHFYRLSVGSFPVVTGAFPVSVPPNAESVVELVGENIPPGSRVTVKSGPSGEVTVPVDAERFRARREVKVLVGEASELVEVEPNDSLKDAMPVTLPCVVGGRLHPTTDAASGRAAKGQATDSDLFRFEAKRGQRWIFETMAARRGSPADTKIEVLRADGSPVPRVVMQAVRDSYINFRPMDANSVGVRLKNWEEMELTQFVWFNGDIARIFRAPQGPDSDTQMFAIGGKRTAYFDTTPTAHANEETCYVVEPREVGAKLVATGLPSFTVNFVNDDDGERRLGTDSKLHFTAPADGTYLARVTEARGFGGSRFTYRLVVREPRPDFKVTLGGGDVTVNRGGGKEFTLSADRTDGFDGDIRVDITGVPAGFSVSTPVVIQAGHREAKGTLNARVDAVAPTADAWAKVKVTATATVEGRAVTKDVNNLGKPSLGERPKVRVFFEPYDRHVATDAASGQAVAGKPFEITLTPGRRTPAWLRIERNGHDDLVTFQVDNLPHGVIVDDIGLNGVLIPKGENERQIFFYSERWVPETDRLAHAIENQAGKQTSLPVLVKVRRSK